MQLVCSLIAEYPKLQADVTSHIPRPTLELVQPLLQKLEKKLQDSYPYTKWGPGRDEYSFNRVKPTLLDIRVSDAARLNHALVMESKSKWCIASDGPRII